MSDSPPSMSPQDALVAVMIAVSASDEQLRTAELVAITEKIATDADYRLGPDAAPGTWFEFTVSTNPGAPPAPIARIASGGELVIARAAGIDPLAISFAGPGKRDAELEAAIACGVTLNLESENEATRALAIAERLGTTPRLAIRAVGEDRRILQRDVDLVVEAVGHPALDLLAAGAPFVHGAMERMMNVVQRALGAQRLLEFGG